MSKFHLTKSIYFAELVDDDNWKEAYLTFNSLTSKDYQQLNKVDAKNDKAVMDASVRLLEHKFIDGKLPDKTGKLVKVRKGDIVEIPIEILIICLNSLKRQIEDSVNY